MFTMYTLLEQSDVFVDAACADQHGQLLFVSVYGRDTSIQQFMARLHESARQGGIDQITLAAAAAGGLPSKPALALLVGDPKRLTKLTGRMPRTGLLGNLVHAWIFDGQLIELDHASRSGWLLGQQIEPTGGANDDLAAWPLVQELAPVPLMAHWAISVLAYLQARQALLKPPCLGPIRVQRVSIPDEFSDWVSDRVRDGSLGEMPTGISRGSANAVAPLATAAAMPLRPLRSA